jgi:LDH2 family malate/lactate/ureidoglycolate dehydrogenase
VIAAPALRDFAGALFAQAGSARAEAEMVAEHLVAANLAGHDSHGVIRVAKYLGWVSEGALLANRHVEMVIDAGARGGGWRVRVWAGDRAGGDGDRGGAGAAAWDCGDWHPE